MPKSPRKPGSSTISWTIPRPTDVLAYSYLWYREAQAGREEGVKDRPVVVVVAIEKLPHGTQLLVVPITTRPPRAENVAIEMPARVQRHLGLGDSPCWIVADEYNVFTWPGPDIRPILRGDEISPRYGAIPAKLFEQLRSRMERLARSGGLKGTTRTD
jgi:hypothetical protein